MAPQPRVFLDLTVGSQPLGRVVFELFTNDVPKTAENFRALCTGEKGISPLSHLPLHYRNSPIHRVIEGFMIQGGDFTKKNGTGGESIYGGTFPDERLQGPGCEVDQPGLLVMANRGKNTNGSQFFVTLAPAPHLTGKHVVFGRVVSGMEYINVIGKQSTDSKDKPINPVTITHCGELELRRPPPKQPTRSISRSPSPRRRSRSRSIDDRRRGGRSQSPRRERSYSDSDSEEERRRRRKERKERKERKREKKGKRAKEPEEETLEELDARLEREENERLEAERIEREEEIKKRKEEEKQRAIERDGVVYKGRGAMRYRDPESFNGRRQPPPGANYDHRHPDTRPRRPRPFGDKGPEQERDQGRWERGLDPRSAPSFQRNERGPNERRGDRDDLDRYKVKRAAFNGADPGREQRKKDWDDWRVSRGREYGQRFEKGLHDSRDELVSKDEKSALNHEGESGGVRGKSPSNEIRGESPPRGRAGSEAGSDMVLDADD